MWWRPALRSDVVGPIAAAGCAINPLAHAPAKLIANLVQNTQNQTNVRPWDFYIPVRLIFPKGVLEIRV